MWKHEDPIPPNPSLYPQQLQLKLYQAFIFSIPILFSIILFLLFYLFYLKRRANNNNRSSNSLSFHESTSTDQSSFISSYWGLRIKGELKEKLQVVQFDEELKAKDLVCCVCLGEFEMKEEPRQVPFCKHVFHSDCIRHWLRANATCPLCRCPIVPVIKMGRSVGLGLDSAQHGNNLLAQQEAQRNVNTISNLSSRTIEHVIQIVE